MTKEKLTCVVCGVTFYGRKGTRYCSKRCANKASRIRYGNKSLSTRVRNEIKADARERDAKRRAMQERLRARDAEYERAFPDTVRGGLRGRAWGVPSGERVMRPSRW